MLAHKPRAEKKLDFSITSFRMLQPGPLRPIQSIEHARVTGVGWLLWNAAESLRAFIERGFTNFHDKTLFFTIEGKQAICGYQRT